LIEANDEIEWQLFAIINLSYLDDLVLEIEKVVNFRLLIAHEIQFFVVKLHLRLFQTGEVGSSIVRGESFQEHILGAMLQCGLRGLYFFHIYKFIPGSHLERISLQELI